MVDSARRRVYGWDVGGAHLKSCRLEIDANGACAVDVAQWATPLWQGLKHLDAGLDAAQAHWGSLVNGAHAVTMSAEMVDGFVDRAAGVLAITQRVAARLGSHASVFAGLKGQRPCWTRADEPAPAWQAIASANWLATALHAASAQPEGVLIDIGSTTTDFIVLRDGNVPTASRSDLDRLISGELLYQGVVRTPLCALAARMPLDGRLVNVMNEWFATTADVYRLTGELNPAHDQQPSADGAPKDLSGTRRRLARMLGCDLQQASDQEWLRVAQAWREQQVVRMADDLTRVLATQARASSRFAVVAAGCGSFLVPDLMARVWPVAALRPPLRAYAELALPPRQASDHELAAWVQVGAPSVAVAYLLSRESL